MVVQKRQKSIHQDYAVCKGLLEQNEVDRHGQFLIAGMDKDGKGDGDLMQKEAQTLIETYQIDEENIDEELETAWDDVSGAALDPSEVKRARAEEVAYIRKMKLYNKVPIEECYAKTGNGSFFVRWIDISKGDSLNPNYRSRLVAREISTCKRDDLFAGTPPLEAFNITLSMTTSGNNGEMLMVNDVSRAFFYAEATRPVYVQLLDEDKEEGEA